MIKVRILNLGFLIALLTLILAINGFSSSMNAISVKWASNFRPHGAYVDEVVFKVYPDIDSVILDLENGFIHAYESYLADTYYPNLLSNPDIQAYFYLDSVYRHLSFNCELFPTNITGFRRAVAFGMDKYRANLEAIGGHGEPLDSYIPLPALDWEIESAMTSHFYSKDIVAGNASLQAAGFKNLDTDGWREYDANGNDVWDAGIDIDNVTCNIGGTETWAPAIICAQIAVEGLNEMGINGTVIEKDFSTLIDDMQAGFINSMCFSWGFEPINPHYLLFEFFRTGEVYHELFYHLNNATIDAALDDMMAATTLAEAKVKAAIAADYLVYEQPMIVCYNNGRMSAERIDKFEGWLNFAGKGFSNRDNPYVVTNVRLKTSEGGPFGGTFTYGRLDDLRTTNILMMDPVDRVVMQYIYESLWNIDPNSWDPIPGLAYDWTIEPTTAGGGYQNGQKFTFQLYPNATWHDGQPVTSEDVKYSFETIWPNSSTIYLDNIYRIDTPDTYTVNIYSNQTGYIEWGWATGLVVLPKHIWEAHGPNFYNWVPSTADIVGSGPYKWSSYTPSDYISLVRHPDWHFAVSRDLPTTIPPTTPPTTPPTSEPSTSQPTSDEDRISPGFEIFTTIVLISGATTVYIKRRRK
ncbi:MAG: ABC transporter substrate-binding protein [Candidatus Hodarchaeota archaeon]